MHESNSTEGGRPLSAEEARWKREAEAARGRVDGQGRMALLLLEVLATLDRERQERLSLQVQCDDWQRYVDGLRAENERLAAQATSMRAVLEAACNWHAFPDGAGYQALLHAAAQQYLEWHQQQERIRPQALSYDKCPGCGMTDCLVRNSPDESWVCDRCHWTSSRAESEARTRQEPTDYPKEADDGD